ncbi:hypothetical protein [Chryseobacterium sp. JUb7]|uniref:hypothetical protein n=1 Tax=Chryseobacterium sp. JUb7 TaxID=2940599 RepID=UPI002168D716|nr:hypothetical protein [Chryseobacterium sp. JUb7]MCS3532755.1 hypothetical protein [Chryseobacterium sp. JUb7]
MKKYFFLSLISSIVFFTGCSSNDENDNGNNPNETQVLLSKITTVYYDNPTNPQTSVTTLDYNSQRQLTKMYSGGITSILEYDTAGKPTKTNYYKADGTLDHYILYSYNGEELTTTNMIYTNSNYNLKTTYNYNNNKLSSITQCQSPNCSDISTTSYTYNGDNISIETSIAGGVSVPTKREYSYDSKKNPYSLLNKYFRSALGGAYILSQNNYTLDKISFRDNTGNWIQNQNITYEIQYNNSQLPTQVIGKDSYGNNYVKYNYEYITQ